MIGDKRYVGAEIFFDLFELVIESVVVIGQDGLNFIGLLLRLFLIFFQLFIELFIVLFPF